LGFINGRVDGRQVAEQVLMLKTKNVFFKVSHKNFLEPGLELEPDFGFVAPWSWSRNL
jgi:hypothetical protein